MPEILRKTLTWDQGREMANHTAIAAATERDVYFCGPHSPWQRRTNENTNGLLHRYFAMGTKLSVLPARYLDDVAVELNIDPAKSWASKLRSKLSKNYSQTRPNRSLLHLPRETARWLSEFWGFVFDVDVDVEHE
jgi:IS30 family transposase